MDHCSVTTDVNPAKNVGFFMLFVSNIPVYQVLDTYDLCQPTECFEVSLDISRGTVKCRGFNIRDSCCNWFAESLM